MGRGLNPGASRGEFATRGNHRDMTNGFLGFDGGLAFLRGFASNFPTFGLNVPIFRAAPPPLLLPLDSKGFASDDIPRGLVNGEDNFVLVRKGNGGCEIKGIK